MTKRKVLAVILFNIALFYVLSQITLTILGLPKKYHYHTFPPQYQMVTDKNIIFVSLPNTSINFVYDGNPRGYFKDNNTVEHITNSYGFRGPQFSIQKASDSARVIFLGDSFTFGEGVYFDDTYPQQFQKMAEATHLFGNKKVEVINLGVSRYDTKQEWALLKDFAYRLKPDLIVIGYVLNDPQPPDVKPVGNELVPVQHNAVAPFILTGLDAPPVPPFLADINYYSRLTTLITQISLEHQETLKNIAYYRSLFADNYAGWQESKKDIQNFGNFSKTNHVPIVTILFPLLFQLNNYPFNDLNTKVINEFTKAGIPTINLLNSLKGEKADDLWVHPTDQHPNEIVHKIAAQALVNEVQSKHLLE